MKKRLISLLVILLMAVSPIMAVANTIDEPTDFYPRAGTTYDLFDRISDFFLGLSYNSNMGRKACGSGVVLGKWCEAAGGSCYSISSCYDYCSPTYDSKTACQSASGGGGGDGDDWPTQDHINRCNNLAGTCSTKKNAVITGGCEPKPGTSTVCINCDYDECADDETCIDGSCESTGSDCTDSDGGRNLYVYGYATDGPFTEYDDCDNGQICEAYCSYGDIVIGCQNCPSGYVCQSGACVDAGTQCQNNCNNGEKECTGTSTYRVCEKEGNCYDWSENKYCEGINQECRNDACVTVSNLKNITCYRCEDGVAKQIYSTFPSTESKECKDITSFGGGWGKEKLTNADCQGNGGGNGGGPTKPDYLSTADVIITKMPKFEKTSYKEGETIKMTVTLKANKAGNYLVEGYITGTGREAGVININRCDFLKGEKCTKAAECKADEKCVSYTLDKRCTNMHFRNKGVYLSAGFAETFTFWFEPQHLGNFYGYVDVLRGEENVACRSTNFVWAGQDVKATNSITVGSQPVCPPGTELCDDGICKIECGGGQSCEEQDYYEGKTEISCTDKKDNDCDKAVDADDSDCGRVPCSTGTERCDDGTCKADCDGGQSCKEQDYYEGKTEISCTDKKDNDCDGAVDADDGDCEVIVTPCLGEGDIFYTNGFATTAKAALIIVGGITSGAIPSNDLDKFDKVYPGFSQKYMVDKNIACCAGMKPKLLEEGKTVKFTKLIVFGILGYDIEKITFDVYECTKSKEFDVCSMTKWMTFLDSMTEDCWVKLVLLFLIIGVVYLVAKKVFKF